MTKEVRAKIITAALGVGLVGFVIGQKGGWSPGSAEPGGSLLSAVQPEQDEPRDVIYRMMDAAKEGDVASYLDCFQGETARRIAQSRDEMGEAEFGEYLSRRHAELKGFAIYEAEPGVGDSESVTIEYVYQDRKEAQVFHLVQSGDEWTIDRMETAERMEVAVPYGTPVY